MNIEGEIRIGALARRARVSVDTLRYYERLGLLAPTRRTAAGYRVYASSAIAEVGFIKAAQGLGMSLEDIAGMRSAAQGGRLALGDLRALIERKLAAIDEQVALLDRGRQNPQRMLAQLRCDDGQKVSEQALRQMGRPRPPA